MTKKNQTSFMIRDLNVLQQAHHNEKFNLCTSK
jgi:hypothetical protein